MDDETRRRLAEVRSLAEELRPEQIEAEIGRARVEAYQAGMRFVADYVEHGPQGGDRMDIPVPRH
jgi:signal transduction histidine kinase